MSTTTSTSSARSRQAARTSSGVPAGRTRAPASAYGLDERGLAEHGDGAGQRAGAGRPGATGDHHALPIMIIAITRP